MRFLIFQRQVSALLYKNLLHRKRALKCTLCEIIAPAVLAMLLLVLPTLIGLDLSVTTQTDQQPFPNASMPFQPRNDMDYDPFMAPNSNWGLFRELYSDQDGNSCWCKTLAIVGDTEVAPLFRAFMESEYAYMKTYYPSVRYMNLQNPNFVPGYTPGADSSTTWVQCPSSNTDAFFELFETEDDLNAYVSASDYGYASETRAQGSGQMDRLCGAVVFPSETLTSKEPVISLRFNTTWSPNSLYYEYLTKSNLYGDTRGLDHLIDQNSARHWYFVQGFVGVQILVERFLRLNHEAVRGSTQTGSFLDTAGQMLNWAIYPFPAFSYTSSSALETLSNLQFVLLFCFATTVALTIGRIVREREQKLREYMRMMGMYDISYYVSWLVATTLVWAIIALGVTGMTFVYAFTQSSFGWVFLFNFLFGLASMSFSFFISALCTRERLGSVIGSFVYFICQAVTVPPYASQTRYNGACILPPSAFIMGVKTMFSLESSRGGFTSETLNTPVNGFTMAQTLYMLAIDVVFWWVLYYYVEQVNPFLFGLRRPFYFPFTASYWKEVVGRQHHSLSVEELTATKAVGDKFEHVTDPRLLQMETEGKCIKVRNLRKKFGANFFAVNGLDLTMYSDEIYCLLGHNGAGKTTTFSMLTGMIAPSSGVISAFGMQIPRDMSELRRSMGVCPQHSALWDDLTVMEHMLIFGGIRGFTFAEIRPTLASLISEVGLGSRANFQARALSGGMKRKLSVGIAFVGDPHVVFLDEPTSGMDPYARRSTWELLKRKRTSGRVICITTHYMDEADVLGDRIAIMAHGKLECAGTSMFLKNLYGCGYLLTFVKESSEEWTNRVITGFIEELTGAPVRIVSAIGKELIVEVNLPKRSPNSSARLPPPLPEIPTDPEFKDATGDSASEFQVIAPREVDDDVTGDFGSLLEELDKPATRARIGVTSYGISVTNIEEVFLKVAQATNKPVASLTARAANAPAPSNPEPTFAKQFMALLERRVRFGLRDRQLTVMQLLVPFLILVISLGFILGAVDGNSPPITLSVAPLNTRPDSNFVQFAPNAGSDEVTEWGEYCAADSPTSEGWSTACNLQVPLVDGLSSPFDFQQTLLDTASSQVYWADMFFGYTDFYNNGSAWWLTNAVTLSVFQNATGIHTSALGALGQFNAWASVADASETPLQVTIVNAPLGLTDWEIRTIQAKTGAMSSSMIIIAMAFIPTAVISFIVMEKEKEVKNQLSISGVSPAAYWLSHFVFDVIVSVASTLAAMITFWIYDIQMFISGTNLGGSFALLLLYGPASIAFAYCVSYLFSRQYIAQSVMAIISFILGNLLMIVSYVLQSIPETSCAQCMNVGETIMWLGRFFPPFALGSGFYRLSAIVDPLHVPLTSSDLFGGCAEGTVFGVTACYSGIGDDLFYLGVMTVVYLGLAIFIDVASSIPTLRHFFVVRGDGGNGDASSVAVEDDDVVAERKRVEGLDKNTQMLYVNKVRKLFRRAGTLRSVFFAKLWGNEAKVQRSTVYAVESVSFAAERGQVFGLLGVNGAGKTTTFKMLCGLYCPSGGEISVLGLDASRQMAQVRRHVGYCPQFDALWDLLSVREHVLLYAKIRGYSGAELHKVVEDKLKELDLEEYREAQAGTLSGGNKRKLSVAMALVGEPELVFLDEPSCGMDPFARRSMWNIIESIAEKRKHSVIVLTTHSMEEAEALCSRVAIQVDGRFRCLGSCQEIKNKYGDGFELNLRAKPSEDPKTITQVLSKWGYASEAAAHGLVMTKENAIEVAAKEMDGLAAKARFEHATYGVEVSAEETVDVLKFAQWVSQDLTFAPIVDFLISEFGMAGFEVIELHGLTLKVKIMKLELSKLFRKLDNMKDQVGIDDFQISQTSLEQIFNKFAATAVNRQD